LLDIEEENTELRKLYTKTKAEKKKKENISETENNPNVSVLTIFKLNRPEIGYILSKLKKNIW